MTATYVKLLVTDGDPHRLADIPNELSFMDGFGSQADFAKAPTVERIADALIANCPELAFLQNVIVRYRWRRKKQAKNGKLVYGTCQSLTGQLQFEMGGGEFLIVLNAENCRDALLKVWQLEALVYHELNHIQPADEDDGVNAKPSLIGHDFEGFQSELSRYGLWHPALEDAGAAFEQLGLWGND